MTVSELRILVENLDEYIHIPGGIERLKKTVLHLAISGQLVAQDTSEGTGHDLFKQIQETHKPKKPLPEITETPFEIPDSWKWVNLAEVVEIKIGKTPSRTEPEYWGKDIPWVSIADLSDKNHIDETKECISSTGLEKCFKGVTSPAGTLLYSFKLTIGKMSIIDMDAVHNEAIASLITSSPITTEYLFKALKIIDPLAKTNSAVMGKTLNSQSLAVIEVPLPPLGEQERIVKRVNKIFTHIDELAKKYNAEETERSKFVRSSLHSLSHSKSSLAFENLADIIKTKADVEVLRKAIMHLAISGQLVPQIKTEGTGEELYRLIQHTYIGSTKQNFNLSFPEEEIPFAIPENWKWVRLGSVAKIIGGNAFSSNDFIDSGVRVIRISDFNENGFTNHKMVFIEATDRYDSYKINRKDILMCMTGGTVGKSLFVDMPIEKLLINQRVAAIRPQSVLPEYINLSISSDHTKSIINQKKNSTNDNISMKDINNFPLPLPPLKEQERIVQKTNELLGLVSELETYL